jgi:hypothetical protein
VKEVDVLIVAVERAVLINPIPGMQDPSRNWSVWVPLDHPAKMNSLIAETIRLPGGKAVRSRSEPGGFETGSGSE